jgi:L-ascorbate metabolism protein UlaG (beta-lactamase superfamily)
MKLYYVAHSTFAINDNNYTILIDPFFKGNPLAKELNLDINLIVVTHGHFDHIADVVELSKKYNCEVYANFELANYLASKGAKANGAYMGGKIKFNWGYIKFVPAFHGSSTPEGTYAGVATGIVINFNGFTFYHAGDTCLTVEMQLLKNYNIDVAMLPIGGYFTMDIEEAVLATKMIEPKFVVPMHYNTFDLIKVNVNEFKELIEKQTNSKPLIMDFNSYIDLKELMVSR